MIKAFITNLGKYNEGELVGEWLEFPATEEEIENLMERIGISDEPDEKGRIYEETFITDYDIDIHGLEFGEYESIETLNECAEALEDLDKKSVEALLYFGYDWDEVADHIDDCKTYTDCDDMEDVAMEIVEELGILEGVPYTVARYFDYEAMGRDLDIEGQFYDTGDGTYIEYIGG